MALETSVTTGACVDLSGTDPGQPQTQGQLSVPPGDVPPQAPPPPKTYSQEDFQKMSSSQYAAGFGAAMKEAGFEPTKGEDLRKQTAAFRAWQDSQKSELQLAAEGKAQAETDRDAAIAKITILERQAAALGKGIPSDRASRYMKLAESYLGEDGDYEKALDAALVDFPIPDPPANASPNIPSFAGKTTGASGATLTESQIKNMSPQELADRWGEVETFLKAQK